MYCEKQYVNIQCKTWQRSKYIQLSYCSWSFTIIHTVGVNVSLWLVCVGPVRHWPPSIGLGTRTRLQITVTGMTEHLQAHKARLSQSLNLSITLNIWILVGKLKNGQFYKQPSH